MTEEVFSQIEPYLPWFRFVHLCGFGEPLMNPRTQDIIQRIYRKGCIVSFVTNGLLLTEKRADEILTGQHRIKEIAVSIDAAHKELYEQIRGKGNFNQLVDNLRALRQRIQKMEHKPRLTWAFLLMKQNLGELPDAVNLAAELGFDRIVGKHLETGNSVDDLKQALFDTGFVPPPDKDEEIRFVEIIKESEQNAHHTGIQFMVHPRRFILDETCGSQPLRALYIDYAGNVSCCCYLTEPDVRPYLHRKPDDDKGVMGNIMETPLPEIIKSRRFMEFASCWARGELPAVCRGCMFARRMSIPEIDQEIASVISTI